MRHDSKSVSSKQLLQAHGQVR